MELSALAGVLAAKSEEKRRTKDDFWGSGLSITINNTILPRRIIFWQVAVVVVVGEIPKVYLDLIRNLMKAGGLVSGSGLN